jgi:predicted exporter
LSYPWRKRLFFLLLPFLLAAVLLNTRVESDLNTFFTATESEDAAFLAGFLQSGELSRRYLIAVEPRPGTEIGADGLAQTLVRQLAELPAVERVWLANRPPREWVEAVQAYAPYHARIYSLDPEAERDAVFDPATLKEKAEGLKQVLLSPQGALVKPIVRHDPLLLSLRGFRGMQGRLQASADGADFAGLILQARAPSLDAEAQGRLQTVIRERFDALNAAAGGAFTLAMTGVPVFTVAAHDQIQHDVMVVSTVSSVGVVLVFLLLFRSFKALHWVMLIVGASYGVGTLATALAFGYVHSLTLALGSTLTGVSIDYPLHVLAHASQFRGESPGEAVRKVWPSLFVGALTTIVGYIALGLTGFPGFQQVAVFSAAAIGATLALTYWVLPALLTSTALHPARVPGLAGWIDFCRRWRKPLWVLFVAGLCGAAVVLPKVRWMEELQNLTLDMPALKQQDQYIRSRLTSIEPGRFVLVKAKDMETALQYSEAAERRLRTLKESGQLSEFFGLYPWRVSARLQQDNATAYGQAVDGKFQSAWRSALAGAGLAVDKLGNLAPVSSALPPDFTLAPDVRHILSGQIVERPDGIALVIWLGEHDATAVAGALADLPGVRYFSQRDLLNGLAKDYRDRALAMLGYGLAAIYLLLWLRYRHGGKAFFSLLPALIAALSIFAAWAALGQEVSFLHVMCLLLAVSICEDYGIFFLDNGGEDIHVTYQAIAASMLTTAISFGALGLAENPVLRVVAVAVTLGVVLGFLLCPLLIRPKEEAGTVDRRMRWGAKRSVRGRKIPPDPPFSKREEEHDISHRFRKKR